MEELLKLFCCNDEDRSIITKPFTQGEYSYASDGHIIIRVDKIEGIEKGGPGLEQLPWDHESLKWEPFPSYEIDPSEYCQACNGTGNAEICTNCNGAEFGCEKCDEWGYVQGNDMVCPICYGSKIRMGVPVKFANRAINMSLCERMKILKGLQLSKYGGKEDPIRFKFDKGIGLVMPMRL